MKVGESCDPEVVGTFVILRIAIHPCIAVCKVFNLGCAWIHHNPWMVIATLHLLRRLWPCLADWVLATIVSAILSFTQVDCFSATNWNGLPGNITTQILQDLFWPSVSYKHISCVYFIDLFVSRSWWLCWWSTWPETKDDVCLWGLIHISHCLI